MKKGVKILLVALKVACVICFFPFSLFFVRFKNGKLNDTSTQEDGITMDEIIAGEEIFE